MDRDFILGLIPHAGSMCLLDAVERWDEQGVVCRSDSHRRVGNPLMRDGALAAIHLVEYGAQAMAVHGGLLASRDGGRAAPGMLTSLRDVKLAVERIDDIADSLAVSARKLLGGPGGWLYEFEVRAGELLLASGRLSVMPLAQ